MSTLKRIFTLSIIVSIFYCVHYFAKPKLIARQILFGSPDYALPSISPDGKKLAYLKSTDGILNVWVRTIGSNNDRQITNNKRSITKFLWSPDSNQILYLQDTLGNENWQLYGIGLSDNLPRNYTPFENIHTSIIAINYEIPEKIIIALNKDNPTLHDAYELYLDTGKLKLVAKNPGDFVGWVADRQLKVRVAQRSRNEGGMDLLYRKTEKDQFTKIISWDVNESFMSAPLGFTYDGTYLYLLDARQSNTVQFIKFNLENQTSHVIAHETDYDISAILMNPKTRIPQGYYVTRAKTDFIVLDPEIAQDIQNIKQLHAGEFAISSGDFQDRQWLVSFDSGQSPVAYYLYDRVSKKGTFLFYNNAKLTQYRLAPMQPINFTARDGLQIEGYITFPLGKAHKNLPAVLVVHGGPWSRDSWGFDSESQWLANRGYVCIQVNFRGSTGYGKKFLMAGDKQWGATMIDDIVDAALWATQRGYVDPKRIGIYGGSYGGFAALMAAATTNVFACAIDLVGPSSIITLLNSLPPYWQPVKSQFYQKVGDPQKEKAMLETQSPLTHAHRIKIPLLIAQGANDPRVKKTESDQIVALLKEKNIAHEYIVFPDEGHGSIKQENRLYFYKKAEHFLAQHLKGQYQS